MITNPRSQVIRKVSLIAAMFSIAACSGQQQQDDDLDVTVGELEGEYDYQEGNELGEDDAYEGNGQENFVEESDNQENYGDSNYNYNEETNSDTDSETAANNYANNINATLTDYGSSDELVSDEDLSTGDYANAAPLVPVVTDDMTAAPMASGSAGYPAASSSSAPIPGGRVRYVMEGGAQVTSGPGGSIILTLTQGDHPVTWEENGFFKMAEGYYISPESLSERGVGRPISGSRWGGYSSAGDYATGNDGYNY